MKKLLSTFLVMAVAVVAMFSGAPKVSAATCTWKDIPILENTLCTAPNTYDNAGTTAVNILKAVFIILFAGIVVIAIFYILKAALKYVKAEGDEKKIEQAKGSMKSILMGVAAVFIGLLGLGIVLVLTNGTGATTGVDSKINLLIKCIQKPGTECANL